MINGWEVLNNPVHTHDCKECIFIMSVRFHRKVGEFSVVDIYKQCGSRGRDKYLFRFSSENSDYASGIDFSQVLCKAAYYFIS